MNINLARSKSGHDKGSIYVIIKEEADVYYLADGDLKPIEKPKKKNRKHIQIIRKLPEEVTAVFNQKENFRNEEIKRALKLYRKSGGIEECQKQM